MFNLEATGIQLSRYLDNAKIKTCFLELQVTCNIRTLLTFNRLPLEESTYWKQYCTQLRICWKFYLTTLDFDIYMYKMRTRLFFF